MENKKVKLFLLKNRLKVLLAVKKGKYNAKIAKIADVTNDQCYKILRKFEEHKIIKIDKKRTNRKRLIYLTEKGKQLEKYLIKLTTILK